MNRWRALSGPLPIIVVALLQAWSAPVQAQSPDNVRKLSAEALFDQGLRLMKDGDHASACPKLAESQRLDPGIGTLLYLADCYRLLGKTASAWVTFREAAFQARRSGQMEREATAASHAAALRAMLTLLLLEFEAVPADVELALDGHPLSPELIEVPFPIDPGRHTLEVSAPNHEPWATTVNIETGRGSLRVEVPALEPRHRPRKVDQPSEPSPSKSSWTGVGWIALGAGLGAIGGAAMLYSTDSDNSLGPLVLGAFGALSAGTGVVILVKSDPAPEPSNRSSTAIRRPLLVYQGTF